MKTSIKQRINLSFFLLVTLFVVNGVITMVTLNNNKKLERHISEVVEPSLKALEDLNQMVLLSKMYTTNWVFLRSKQEDKNMLTKLHKTDYSELKKRFIPYEKQWDGNHFRDSLHSVYTHFEVLLSVEKNIMASLQRFEDYDDLVTRLEAERLIEDEVLPRTDAMLCSLADIIAYCQQVRLQERENLQKSSFELKTIIISLAVIIFLAGIFLAIYLKKVIIGPINTIKNIVNDLGKGIVRKSVQVTNNDEIGDMVQAVNSLSEKTLTTAQFAYEVGIKNFDIPFQPLSNEDVLGRALIMMRDNLKISENEVQQSADNLRKKDQLLQAVAAATHELISNKNAELSIAETIRLLGQKMQLDSVSVYKKYGDLNTDGCISQLMRWSDNSNDIIYKQEEMQNLRGIQVFETLARNEIYMATTTEVNDPLVKKILENFKVRSLVAIPVFASGMFWGFVSFNECKNERLWTETEVSILRSFALTLGSAIDRNIKDEELLIAKESAEAASIAKSEFMANMSHELRTPMNSIIGFTDLVLTSQMPKTQREYLQNVSKSSYNLLNIINDILDFSKIEAGKLSIDETGFNLVELVEETVEMLAIKAHEKSLEIICRIDPSIPVQFMGDASRIRQILINLIGNAIKFTDKGEIFVTVNQSTQKVNHHSTGIRNMTISVKDTGIGIVAEKVQSIFESFTQADSSTTRKFGGTGLGLTISKGLAELMKGTITVNSTPGEGSEFSLQVPLMVIKETPALSVVAKGSLNKVLVIDDNLSNCQLMQGIFEYLNISCTICFSGYDALNLIRQSVSNGQIFDLIITDHQMPGMDGITLVREIKKLLGNSVEPFILMLSSLEKTMFQHEAENIGIDKFLSKPVKLNELINLLSYLFERTEKKKDVNEDTLKMTKFRFGGQILVAEDHLMNMLLIKEVLTNMGLEVIQASNGQQVLDLLEDNEPILIFMDINMPILDGFETTKRIRALNTSRKDIPIIALTADAMKEDKERCRQSGMNDYVSKPFRLKEIESVLQAWIPSELKEKTFRA